MRYKNILFCIAVLLLLLCFTVVSASAAGNLPDGFVIIDDKQIRVPSDGRYYILAEDLAPHDHRTKHIEIKNTRSDKAFNLFLSVEALDKKGTIDLFKDVEVTITYDGKQLFKGSADGTGTIDMKEPVSLGTFTPGDAKEMDVEIDFIRDKIDNSFGSCTFRWTFQAVVDETFIPPKTGMDENSVVWMLIGAMFLVGTILVIIKHQRDKKARREEIV